MGEIKLQRSQNSSHHGQPLKPMHFSLVNRLSGPMCQFPFAAEQSSPNLVAVNNTNLLSYNFGGQKFENGCPWTKITVPGGQHFFLVGLREKLLAV